MRYTLEIEVTGNAEAKLIAMSSAMGKVAHAAEELGHSTDKASHAAEGMEKKVHGHFLGEFSEKLEGLSETFKGFAESVIEGTKKLVESLIETGSEFEDIKSSMDFSFGAGSQEMYGKAMDSSKDMALTFKQTADMVANFGRVGVNMYGKLGEETVKFKDKLGNFQDMPHIFQDVAMGVGISFNEIGRFTKGMEHAAIGNFKMLRGLLPHKILEELKKDFASAAGDVQKSTELMAASLAKTFGGATKMREGNWSFQVQQLHDKMELLKGDLMAGTLPLFTKGLTSFVDALARLRDDKEVMESLRSGVKTIATFAELLGKWAGKAVDSVREFVKLVPWLPQMSVGVIAITVAGSFLLAVLLSIGAALVAIVATFMAVGWEAILGVAVGMLAMAPVLAVMAVIAVGLGVALKGTADVISDKWGGTEGVFGIFEKGKALFEGLSEMFESFDGKSTKISVETAGKLRKMGLWNFFMDLQEGYFKLNEGWKAFKKGLDDVAGVIGPVLIPLIEEITDLFNELTGDMDGGKTKVTDWKDAGLKMAMALAEIGKWTIYAIRAMVGFVRIIVHVFDLGHAFSRIKSIIHGVTAAVEKLSSVIGALAKMTGFDLLFGGGGGKEGEKKGGFLSSLFHEKATLSRPADLDLRNSEVKDFGLGDGFNKMGIEEKKKELSRLYAEGNVDHEKLARVGRGEAANDKQYEKGMNFESWMSAPVQLTPSSPNSTQDNLTGSAASMGPAQNMSMDPRMMYSATEKQNALLEKLVVASQADRNISVQIDGRELAKANQSLKTSTSGR